MTRFQFASFLLLASAAGFAQHNVLAQDNPIAARKAILKGFGESTKAPVGMLRGETPFDIAPVKAALQTLSTGSKKLPSLFPPDSKTGGDTAASPKIWDEKEKFDAIYAKLDVDATAANTAIVDEASFKKEFPKVLGNCKTCHDDYRLKK